MMIRIFTMLFFDPKNPNWCERSIPANRISTSSFPSKIIHLQSKSEHWKWAGVICATAINDVLEACVWTHMCVTPHTHTDSKCVWVSACWGGVQECNLTIDYCLGPWESHHSYTHTLHWWATPNHGHFRSWRYEHERAHSVDELFLQVAQGNAVFALTNRETRIAGSRLNDNGKRERTGASYYNGSHC